MSREFDWPFDQPENAAAISDSTVLEKGAPILLVVHYSDDHGWAFLSGLSFKVAQGKVIAMREALRRDPTLRSVASLLPGCSATREYVGGPWTHIEYPDV